MAWLIAKLRYSCAEHTLFNLLAIKEIGMKQPQKLSIIAQALYLGNLLAVPVLSLLLLCYLFYHNKPTGLARIHFIRAIQLTVLNMLAIGALPLLYVYLSAQSGESMMLALFYFVCVHTAFVMLGMFNLSRAMAKKLPVF